MAKFSKGRIEGLDHVALIRLACLGLLRNLHAGETTTFRLMVQRWYADRCGVHAYHH